jgi:hypothetical protein
MKDLLLQHLTKCAALHVGLAKEENTLATESSGATKKAHEAKRELHTDAGEHCVRMCKKLAASNVDSIDDVRVGTESNRGKGGDLDGPTEKAAQPFGMREALGKAAPAFGMAAARRDLDKVVPTEVRGAVPSAPNQMIARPGGKAVPTVEEADSIIDSFLT